MRLKRKSQRYIIFENNINRVAKELRLEQGLSWFLGAIAFPQEVKKIIQTGQFKDVSLTVTDVEDLY